VFFSLYFQILTEKLLSQPEIQDKTRKLSAYLHLCTANLMPIFRLWMNYQQRYKSRKQYPLMQTIEIGYSPHTWLSQGSEAGPETHSNSNR